MYEHVKTSYKNILPSEQPLQFLSGYFLNKPRIFPHYLIAHNSATAPILRQNNPCYISLHMDFWSIPKLFCSQKSLKWTSSLKSSGQNFEWAPQLWYLHHECRTFRSPWFYTLIVRDCTYYGGLLYVIFYSILLHPHIYGQIFSPGTPTSATR